MKKYKVYFYHFEQMEPFISRSIPWDSVMVLFILSNQTNVYYKKNRNTIRFRYERGDDMTFVEVKGVSDSKAKEIMPMEYWKERGTV